MVQLVIFPHSGATVCSELRIRTAPSPSPVFDCSIEAAQVRVQYETLLYGENVAFNTHSAAFCWCFFRSLPVVYFSLIELPARLMETSHHICK